ncbi:hypothetical protein [Polycyclovorans algicola]|uniref:hypothetical protein n=1 Tax=Polycyclovorans algicola TaxID=616992 RepID=UPI0004A70462|nr:hypothetical protein [Polycyclovorans algicola]
MKALFAGHPERKALDKIQGNIANALAALEALEQQPMTVDEAAGRLRGALQREWPEYVERKIRSARQPGAGPNFSNSGDDRISAQSLIIWGLGVEAIVARAKATWEGMNVGDGITQPDRRAKHTELTAKLKDLELAEEREACRLEALDDNTFVMRREEPSGEILIEVWQSL